MDEDSYSDSYMLDRMCYLRAVSAESAYPPTDEAEVEKLLIAQDVFEDMEMYGHDPKRRAERYAKERDKERPNWSWYDEK